MKLLTLNKNKQQNSYNHSLDMISAIGLINIYNIDFTHSTQKYHEENRYA